MTIKKRICSSIDISPIHNIDSIDLDGTINFKTGKSWVSIPIKKTGKFSESFKLDTHGFTHVQKIEFGYIENKYNFREFAKPSIFRLTFDNGEVLIKGTKDNPFVIDPSKKDTNEVNVIFSHTEI